LAPATQHIFNEEPLPAAVVLDSDFVISVLHDNEEFHEICVSFAIRLRAAAVRIVYTPLMRIDFWNGWRQAVGRRGLPAELTEEIAESEEEHTRRELVFRHGDRLLEDFLSGFDAYRLDLSPELLDQALAFIARYNLRPHDGCLAATTFHSGVNTMISLDADFIRLDGLELWNDDVPSTRARRRGGLR
jgi:predicted nucleic acid-binding protein